MPYKPEMLDTLPEWIYDLSGDDQCLLDILTEAWVAGLKARGAILQRGNDAPHTCVEELKNAEGLLDALRDGRTPSWQLARKAAQAVRKFDTVQQCCRFLASDTSPRFVRERFRRGDG